MTPLALSVRGHLTGRRLLRCRSGLIKLGSGTHDLAPMPKQDTEILKVLLGQIRDDREINAVVNKALAVLVKADRSEPFSNAGHGGPPLPLFHTYTTEEPRGGT